jgi:hypothetical protein
VGSSSGLDSSGARGDAPVTDTTMMVAEGSSPSRSTRVMSCESCGVVQCSFDEDGQMDSSAVSR